MFYILDGSGFLFRAYYSLPKILDKNWNESWAIFGFFRMLLKLLQEKPDNFIIVFDPGTKTKRQEEFKEYKQNRPEIDEWFKQQIPKIIQILKDSNFDVEIIPEYEADDVIASLVETIKKQDKAVVVSSDKDLKQLIDDNVEFLEPKKMDYVDKNKFLKEYGFKPENMLLYLALLGDASDNIPGVKWIWPKTARKVVEEVGRKSEEVGRIFDENKKIIWENFLQAIKGLPEKLKNSIIENKELLERNIDLIKLRSPGNFDFQQIKSKSNIKNIDFEKLKKILVQDYGFKSFDNLISKAKKEISQPTQLGLF